MPESRLVCLLPASNSVDWVPLAMAILVGDRNSNEIKGFRESRISSVLPLTRALPDFNA